MRHRGETKTGEAAMDNRNRCTASGDARPRRLSYRYPEKKTDAPLPPVQTIVLPVLPQVIV
jgi:hypothetical protein